MDGSSVRVINWQINPRMCLIVNPVSVRDDCGVSPAPRKTQAIALFLDSIPQQALPEKPEDSDP